MNYVDPMAPGGVFNIVAMTAQGDRDQIVTEWRTVDPDGGSSVTLE